VPDPTEGDLVGSPADLLSARRMYASAMQPLVKGWSLKKYPELRTVVGKANREQVGERGNSGYAYFKHILKRDRRGTGACSSSAAETEWSSYSVRISARKSASGSSS
jgi:hypothetical protein